MPPVWVGAIRHSSVRSAGAMSPAQVARLATFHTTLDEVGEVATAAGVKTLVLSHLGPPDPELVTDAMWRAGAQATFAGEVVVGRDLLEI